MKEINNLPDGYTSRPATMEDIPDAAKLFNLCSKDMIGKQDYNITELQTDWTAPGIDPQKDFRVTISPSGELVGFIEVWATHQTPVHPNIWGRVHPDHTDKGIGTALLTWAEKHARQVIDKVPAEARVAMHAQIFDSHQPSNDLLRGYGMEVIRHGFQMRIPLSEKAPGTGLAGWNQAENLPDRKISRQSTAPIMKPSRIISATSRKILRSA